MLPTGGGIEIELFLSYRDEAPPADASVIALGSAQGLYKYFAGAKQCSGVLISKTC